MWLKNNSVLVLSTITNHMEFICILQNLCSSENDEVCLFTFKIIIQLCQLQKEKTKTEHMFLVWFIHYSIISIILIWSVKFLEI